MKCRAETQNPRGLRFPVPLDKGNEGSGNEIDGNLEQNYCLSASGTIAHAVLLANEISS